MSGVHALLVVLAIVIIALQVKTIHDLGDNALPKGWMMDVQRPFQNVGRRMRGAM